MPGWNASVVPPRFTVRLRLIAETERAQGNDHTRGDAARPWLTLREAISSMSGPGVIVSARHAPAKSARVDRLDIASFL